MVMSRYVPRKVCNGFSLFLSLRPNKSFLDFEIENISVSKVKLNPNNPRLVKDDKFKKLVVECMARPIGNHDGDVYEPFNGSGTTMVAGHQLGRKVYAIEIKPEYVQITIDRMRKLDPSIEIKRNGVVWN